MNSCSSYHLHWCPPFPAPPCSLFPRASSLCFHSICGLPSALSFLCLSSPRPLCCIHSLPGPVPTPYFICAPHRLCCLQSLLCLLPPALVCCLHTHPAISPLFSPDFFAFFVAFTPFPIALFYFLLPTHPLCCIHSVPFLLPFFTCTPRHLSVNSRQSSVLPALCSFEVAFTAPVCCRASFLDVASMPFVVLSVLPISKCLQRPSRLPTFPYLTVLYESARRTCVEFYDLAVIDKFIYLM